jgi:hypothetical protein
MKKHKHNWMVRTFFPGGFLDVCVDCGKERREKTRREAGGKNEN